MKNIKKIFITSFVILLIALPVIVLAQTGSVSEDILGGVTNVGKGAGYKTVAESGTLPEVVGKIIKSFLGLLGILFTILIIYGGYTWMTSFGETNKIKKAKDLIVDAIIGIAIILASYIITSFVVNALISSTIT